MTAVVALLTASITTWLTTKSANKRSATELEQQRARFAQELEHQRELERRKLLFGLRSEIYLKITQVFADAVTALSVSRSDRSEGNAETVLELAGRAAQVAGPGHLVRHRRFRRRHVGGSRLRW